MNRDDVDDMVKILLDISNIKGYVTYEDINRLFPQEIDINKIEELFSLLHNKGITIEEDKNELLINKEYKQKIEQSISNYIDTPEKFYFWEIRKTKKFDKEVEEYYSKKITDIKLKIRDLIINSNYFINRLLRDFYKIKKGQMNFNELFNNKIRTKEKFELFQNRLKKLYKNRIMIRHKKNGAAIETEINNEIIQELKKNDIKFRYIELCITELNQKLREYNLLKVESENIKSKYNLNSKQYKDILNDVQFNISADLAFNTPIEKDIKNYLKRERNILNWFSMFKISPSECRDLLNKINRLNQEYEKLKQLMINTRLAIVIDIARYYSYKGASFDDLIQDGNLALLEALEKYDYYRCKKNFSAYASWWIRKKLSNAVIENKKNLKITNSLKKDIKQFLKAVHKLKNLLLRNPSEEDLASELGWKVEKVQEMLEYLKKPLSLDATYGNGDLCISAYLADPNILTPDDIVINNIMKEKIYQVVSKLTDLEQIVITLRFGINDSDHILYYEDIAEILNIPVGRIKYIEQSALRKLKYLGKKAHLDDFL